MMIAHACIATIWAVWMAGGVTGVDTIEIVPKQERRPPRLGRLLSH